MKQFKLAFLLTVLMSMVGANAYAQNEPFKVDGIYYRYSPYQDYSVDVVHPNATAVEEDDQSISIPSSYLGSITIPSFISVTKTVTDMNEWGDEYTHEETHSYSVENIGSCAFSGSEITSIVIPNSVTSILSGAFAWCTKLSSIIIPNSVVGINQYAFSGCSGLNSVDIPQSVIYLGESAFAGCDNLTSVTVRMEVPVSIDESVFSNRTNATLYVPAGCKEAYMAAPYWQDFKEIVEMSPIITFADYYVKDICVSKWDTDGDGELSEDEAAAVTSLGFAFKNNRNIKTFDEFRYFTGLTSIRDEEFYYCTKLTSVTIPNSVTSIGDGAFDGCSGLTSVTIGNSVTSIGMSAFDSCSGLTSVTIPNSVTSIGDSAFDGCSGLTSISVEKGNSNYDSRDNCNAIIETATNTLIAGCMNTIIPNSVTSIGGWAFFGCSGLTTIVIPNSVTSIGDYAFYGCSGLTSVTIGNSVTRIVDSAFCGCSGLTSVTIPNSVTSIGSSAFYGCSGLTSVTIPNSVTSIGEGAFGWCSGLTSVTIPNSVTSIGDNAFFGCSGLTSVIVEIDTPLQIASNVFSNRANATLYVPAGCKAAYEAADYWKEFKEIVEMAPSSPIIEFADANVKALCVANWDTDGDGELSEAEAAAVTDLGSVFNGNKTITAFEELRYFTGLTSIYYDTFYGCSHLTFVTIPNSVTYIADHAFDGCEGLTFVIIPNSVTTIGACAFQGCYGLTSVTIGNSVKSIGEAAFNGCCELTSVTIPNSVTSIGNSAFSYCTSLITIVVESENPKYDSRNGCNAIIETATNTLVVGCMNTIIPNSVTSIGIGAFNGCSGLTSVTIPNSVTSIGQGAFQFCSGLTSVTIGNSVMSIGNGAFYECISLATIVVEPGNPKYDSRNDCNAIIETSTNTLVTGCMNTIIPNSVMSIGEQAFYLCTGLTSIEIPNSVTSIGYEAFGACYNLASVIVEHEIPLQITSNVFSNRAKATLYVPVGCKAAYEAANYWKEFKEIVEMAPASEPGDLNGDGIINGIDLVAQTNLIMTDQYNAAADLNNDGFVNGLDYVIMVNMIMSFTSAPAMQAAGSNRAAATASLSIEDFDIKAGETKELLINLSNPDMELTLLQFDMRLPEGLSIATEDGDYAIDIAGRTTWKKHSLMAKDTNGITRFLLASNTNALIDGNDGNVISIKLTASDGFTCGDIMLENQLLVSPNAEDMMPADFIYSVGSTTSIDAIMAGQPVDVYTLTGTKVLSGVTSIKDLPKGIYIIKGKKVIVK